jgi:hypothetical protein
MRNPFKSSSSPGYTTGPSSNKLIIVAGVITFTNNNSTKPK